MLQPFHISSGVWEEISLDFIEGLPNSQRKDTILVVIDRMSKYTHFVALSHPYFMLIVAQTFMNQKFRLHGFPISIVSNHDPVFVSKFLKEFFRLQEVTLHSIAYHPHQMVKQKL